MDWRDAGVFDIGLPPLLFAGSGVEHRLPVITYGSSSLLHLLMLQTLTANIISMSIYSPNPCAQMQSRQ